MQKRHNSGVSQNAQWGRGPGPHLLEVLLSLTKAVLRDQVSKNICYEGSRLQISRSQTFSTRQAMPGVVAEGEGGHCRVAGVELPPCPGQSRIMSPVPIPSPEGLCGCMFT